MKASKLTADGQPHGSSGAACDEMVRFDIAFRARVASSSIFRLHLHVKRLLDIVASSFLILLLLPLLPICYLAVRLSSRGPFIFQQPRWGLRGCHFPCYKIRSMHSDKAQGIELQQPSAERERGILLKRRDDPRVTRVGAILRKLSIDELPQLFNVLRGDMSLVGPRPLVIHMLAPFPDILEARCVVRPGITGLWQIRNRAHNTSVLDMIDDDAEYIANYDLWLDFRILLVTPAAVISGKGAH